ncbi:short-chain dehydrogenase/reductase family 9C member 7-like [Oculina patagonica]
MSWFIPVLIGFLAIYLVKRLIPRSKLDVKDKYVLITGCDSGFGRETAIRLDEMGVNVIATCLTKEGEQSLKSVTSDKLKTFQMDVTKSQQIYDVCKEVTKMIPYGTGLWGVVNNAGILYSLPIEWTPLHIFKRMADVNLWGMIDVTKTFLPLLKKARGRIVNFSSVSGQVSFNLVGAYAVSKYGVEAFSDALRREMHPWGIKVSIMEPGGFQTNMNERRAKERQIREAWNNLSEELKKEYGEEYLEKCISFLTGVTTSPHTHKVVDAVVDALTSQSPRDRYLIGLVDQIIIPWMVRLPTTVADFIVTRVFYRNIVPLGSRK